MKEGADERKDMFGRRAIIETFDRENQKPIIRSSICNGEQVAGFKNVNTGKFTEIMVIRNRKDMDEFMKRYGIFPEEIKKEW